MPPKEVDVSGSILERGLEGSLKSRRTALMISGLNELCKLTRRMEFEVVLLEVCMT